MPTPSGPAHVQWIQLNVGLVARSGSLLPAEGEFFAALGPLLDAARTQGLECFWFVRKDPCLRLRFGGTELPAGLSSELAALMDQLRRDGVVRESFASVYEPETFLLGGPDCLGPVMRYFDRDCALWLSWREAHGEQPLPFTRDVISLAVMGDLVERCVGPLEEVWDVWCRLRELYGTPKAALDIPLIGPADLGKLGGARVRPMTDGHLAANRELAEGIDRVWRRGSLMVGRRALTATIASFHWNRFRVDESVVAQIADLMARAYDPAPSLPPEARA